MLGLSALLAGGCTALAIAVTPATAAAGGPRSTIFDRAYQPAALTVAAGQTVIWHNETLGPHTVTSTTELFDSGRLDSGNTFTLNFATPGTFNYYCTVHPTMKGVVTVLPIPAERVLVRIGARRTAHGRTTVVHVEVARSGVSALLQIRAAGGWTTVARGRLSSLGAATMTLGGGSRGRARVVVPAAYGQPRLVSSAARLPA
jgi:plastocyanin